jgi:hypothetical protein
MQHRRPHLRSGHAMSSKMSWWQVNVHTWRASPIPLIKYANIKTGKGGAEDSMQYARTWHREPKVREVKNTHGPSTRVAVPRTITCKKGQGYSYMNCRVWLAYFSESKLFREDYIRNSTCNKSLCGRHKMRTTTREDISCILTTQAKTNIKDTVAYPTWNTSTSTHVNKTRKYTS